MKMKKYLKIIKWLVPGKYCIAIKSFLYAGNSVHCPLCGGNFRKFLAYGVISRPGAQCPKCGSLERFRLLWLYLKNKTNIFNDNLRVLHFAPEPLIQERLKSKPNLDYISSDLNPINAMLKMDITDINFKDDTFDVIICSHVLEHILDDGKAMRELFRVLKPGGWSIIQVPIQEGQEKTFEDPTVQSPEDRERLFGQFDHVRRYGLDFKDRLKDAGFRVSVDNYGRELGNDLIKKYGLGEQLEIYLCTKDK